MRDLMLVLKAVADKNRMRILKMLEKKNMCVCELAAVLEITQPSVSKHLSILKNAGFIEDARSGQWIEYSTCHTRINEYAPVLQATVKKLINDDPLIMADREKAKNLDRVLICKKD